MFSSTIRRWLWHYRVKSRPLSSQRHRLRSYYQTPTNFRPLITMNRRSHSTSSNRVTQFDSWHLYLVPYHHTNQTWDISTNHQWPCWRWPKLMAKTSLKQVASRKKPQLFAVWLRFKHQLTGWKLTWLVSRDLSPIWCPDRDAANYILPERYYPGLLQVLYGVIPDTDISCIEYRALSPLSNNLARMAKYESCSLINDWRNSSRMERRSERF